MISLSRLVQLSLFYMSIKDPILYHFKVFIFPSLILMKQPDGNQTITLTSGKTKHFRVCFSKSAGW